MSRNNSKTSAPSIEMPTIPPDGILEMPKQNLQIAQSEPVALPSQGRFYHPSYPLHGVDTLEVRYPTARDQDILLNKTYIQKMVSIDKLIESVVSNPMIDVRRMLLCDKEAIAMQTRINMHGEEYKSKVICPFCLEKYNSYSINLSERTIIRNAPSEEEMAEHGVSVKNLEGYVTFFLKTKKHGLEIEFALASGETEEIGRKLTLDRKKRGQLEANRTNELKALIKSIDGVRGNQLFSVIDNMPSLDVNEFMEAYRFVSPSISIVQPFECTECSHQEDLTIPVDVNFFWYKP